MPHIVAYQKYVVYAFIKLSAKSHSFNILCTMDGLSCPTTKGLLYVFVIYLSLKKSDESLTVPNLSDGEPIKFLFMLNSSSQWQT